MPIANQSTDLTDTKNPPKRVVMLLANPFTHDTRVHKQARTLIQWGLEVHIVCIAKPDLPDHEITDGIHVHRVPVKDESVFRIIQGVTKLRSADLLREWLERSFEIEPELPEVEASKSRKHVTPIADPVLSAEPVAEHQSEPVETSSIDSIAGNQADQEVVCPLPPIEPMYVKPVPPLESNSMRLLAFPSSLSARSAWIISRFEQALLSTETDSILSQKSASILKKPSRASAHLVLKISRLSHRLCIHPVSTRCRILLSRATTRASREHAELVREHRVATIMAEREAARNTVLRDARYVKQMRAALSLAQAQEASQRTQQHKHSQPDPTGRETLKRIRSQAARFAKQEAIAHTLAHKAITQKKKLQTKNRSAWVQRFRKLLRRIPSAVRIIGFNDELARTALKLDPDVVLSHDCNTLLAGRMLKEVTGCPLVYDSHELFLERNIGSRRRWVDKLCWWPIERSCIGHTDAAFTVAEGIARHLEQQFNLPEVYLLRNVQPYEPPPAPLKAGELSLMHQEFGLDPSTRVVIYPGAITINRGLEFMIDAAGLLDNAVFVVMGYANSEPYMEEILRRATENGTLNTRIFFKDAVPIDDVGRWVAGSSLGVVPTQGVCMSYRFEASNKMFHCLMAGVPLAMSDHPEKRILADRYGVGTLFDETSAESIAKAINATLNDEAGMERMKRNCLEAAKALNWEHEVHRYLTVMSTLLPEHSMPVPPVYIPALHDSEDEHAANPVITIPKASTMISSR